MSKLTIVPPVGKDTSWRWQMVKRARLRIVMYEKQDGTCWWCTETMSMEPFRTNANGDEVHNQRYASIEHLIERKNGGTDARWNLVLAHASCNRNRHKRKWPHDPVYGIGANEHAPA